MCRCAIIISWGSFLAVERCRKACLRAYCSFWCQPRTILSLRHCCMWSAFLFFLCQLLKFFSSCNSILASLVTFSRKSAVWLCPGHTMLCLCTWALLPWLVHSILEWDLKNHWMCHCSCVCMEAMASHLSLTCPCSGWQNWEGRVFFLLSGEQSELSLGCCRNRVHLWDNALTCEERLVTRSGMRNISLWHCPSNASVFCYPSPQCGAFYQVQRQGVKGQAKIFWLLFGLPCCESCGPRFCINPFLLNPALPATGQAVLHWDSSSWGAAGMITKKQQYTTTQQGKQ